MRFWLILLAMLSGLSLGDVARAACPAEVVGVAECASAVSAPKAGQCQVRQRIARARLKPVPARPSAPSDAGLSQPFGITLTDRPLE